MEATSPLHQTRITRSAVDAPVFPGDPPLPVPFILPSAWPADSIRLVIATHWHDDHIDPQSLLAVAQASPEALVCVPEFEFQRPVHFGIHEKRVRGFRGEEDSPPVLVDGLTITGVPSAHMRLEYTEKFEIQWSPANRGNQSSGVDELDEEAEGVNFPAMAGLATTKG